MEFGLAAILTMRRAELAEFTDAVVNRADVRQTIDKIDYTVYSDEEAAANGYALLTTLLDIALKDGRRFSARADAAYGSSEMPMNEEQISGKFRACAEFAGWRVQRTEKLIETILRLEELEDVQTLAELLQSEA